MLTYIYTHTHTKEEEEDMIELTSRINEMGERSDRTLKKLSS